MGIYLSVTAREAGSKGKYRPRRAQEPFDSNCGPVGVERAEGDGVVPVHGEGLQPGVHISVGCQWSSVFADSLRRSTENDCRGRKI